MGLVGLVGLISLVGLMSVSVWASSGYFIESKRISNEIIFFDDRKKLMIPNSLWSKSQRKYGL